MCQKYNNKARLTLLLACLVQHNVALVVKRMPRWRCGTKRCALAHSHGTRAMHALQLHGQSSMQRSKLHGHRVNKGWFLHFAGIWKLPCWSRGNIVSNKRSACSMRVHVVARDDDGYAYSQGPGSCAVRCTNVTRPGACAPPRGETRDDSSTMARKAMRVAPDWELLALVA